MNIAIIRPSDALEADIVQYWPLRYHYHVESDTIVMECSTFTKDPFTGDCMLTIKTEFTKVSLYAKSGSFEDIRKWGY